MSDTMSASASSKPQMLWPWVLGAAIACAAHGSLYFVEGARKGQGLAEAAGAAVGACLLFPVVVVAVFGIGKRFRSRHARLVIFFCVSVLSALARANALVSYNG